MRKEAVKFVTKEEFDEILGVTKRPLKDARQTPSPEWFPLVLRVIFATGCRPAEVVGTHGREGVDEEEALNRKTQSRVKPHPGMTPGDVLPNYRIKVHGKHTTPKGRTDDLKERVVLCADGDVYRELRTLADERLATHTSGHNLFLPDSRDGKEALWDQMRKLQLRLPAKWRHFSDSASWRRAR